MRWCRGRGGTLRPGRDRRAVHLPGPEGRADTEHLDRRPRVVVAGGGIAGLSAATVLAERGVEVVLCERESYLGGRVGSWSTRLASGSTVTMSRGFHAFFRQYYNLRRLLRRADPAAAGLIDLRDYPLLHADGHRDSFSRVPRTPPWNALGFLLRTPTFRWQDLARVDTRAALLLLDVAVPRVYDRLDGLDADSYLRALRFPATARHLALSVFSRSFFVPPEQLSAAELATMFHIYFFGSAEGLVFDTAAGPFGQVLWDPLRRHLENNGAVVRSGTVVSAVTHSGPRRYQARTANGEAIDADAVVLALNVRGLQAVCAASPDLGDPEWRARIAALGSAPPFLVSRLWLDRPIRADRPAFLGTAGFGILDNVSVLDRYEREAREWARQHRGSVVELHAYALPEGTDKAWARRELVRHLHQVYPETAGAHTIDERHEWRTDCPLFPPGSYSRRPDVCTTEDFLVLAGDLVRVDLPVALMERAATSGVLAANALLSRWGVQGESVWSVPTTGRVRLLRTLASRLGRVPRFGAAQPGQRPVVRSS
ncbi:dehydrogenase [Longimycelium tulufanense]|uniref:Dehydrogenase n=1 Tax=Longimycelium tulufanense TaxID=907463 RepID=A0A8J3CFU2_9PSEU|nr:FAD-dependent oxidoreductase [Longimycelium tulufanense]GGM60300.1 dehydrogenase [Longimycelium tulufanense]